MKQYKLMHMLINKCTIDEINYFSLPNKIDSDEIIVKSKNTARVQEAHIFLGHFILQMVEKKLKSLSLI